MKNIEEIIKTKGIYVCRTKGDSMYPMLREGKDTVIITAPKFPLKKYDVPVYRRDDHYTMHRIIKVKKDGYVICGDNRIFLEKDIKDKDIVGVLTGFYRESHYVDCENELYLKYAKKIVKSYYKRLFKHVLIKILQKIGCNKCF